MATVAVAVFSGPVRRGRSLVCCVAGGIRRRGAAAAVTVGVLRTYARAYARDLDQALGPLASVTGTPPASGFPCRTAWSLPR